MNKPSSKPWTQLFLLLFLAQAGILLFQYFFNRSLWLDESMLALAIINSDFSELFKPLPHSQVAPILFLLIEKLNTLVFGTGEKALRLFPLLSALGSLILIYLVSYALTGKKQVGLIAMTVLCCSPAFIFYSSEQKQYIVDLAVMLGLFLVTFYDSPFLNKYRYQTIAAAGGIACFLSNVSVIMLTVLGGVLLYRLVYAVRNKAAYRAIFIPLIVWAICFSTNYFLFIKGHPHQVGMKAYWSFAFMPSPFAPDFKNWISSRGSQIFYEMVPIKGGLSLLLTCLIYFSGIAHMLFSRKFLLAYLCTAPVLIHFLLSFLRLYPYDIRLVLYQLPLFIIVFAYLIDKLAAMLFTRKLFNVMFIIISCFLLFSFRAFRKFPLQREEIKKSMQVIEKEARPGDSIYVYYGAWAAFTYYYQQGYPLKKQLPFIIGHSSLEDNNGYLEELRSISGRVWVLFSHGYPFDGSRKEEKFIVGGLEKRGKLIRQFEDVDTAVYLFELQPADKE
jgi:hypothetical protein